MASRITTISLLVFVGIPAQICLAASSNRRFCVGVNFDTRTAYLTQAFDEPGSPETVESRVGAVLRANGLVLQNLQCPLPADELEILDRIEKARTLLRGLGLRVVDIGK
jgi:hypothetical protein